MAKSKLQKLGKEEVARRVKIKASLKKKEKIKTNLFKLLLSLSLLLNLFYLSLPYHSFILTNIIEAYYKVAPIVESLFNKLPL